MYVIDFHGNDERFAYYLLKSLDFRRYNSGSAQPSLNRNYIHPIPIKVPPLPEQRAFASILGALDDRIDLNRRMNETLEAMARATFKSWFVDFDPVRAMAEGRQPDGLDAATAALFPDAFEDSPLGKLPKGWPVGSILDIADLLSGGTPKTGVTAYWNGSVQWASAKDVSQCRSPFLLQTERTITDEGVRHSAARVIPAKATVVVARGATTGRHCMLGSDMAMNQTCYALHARNGEDYLLFCWLGAFEHALTHAGHGSVFTTITTGTFESSRFVIPPFELRQAYHKAVASYFDRLLSSVKESDTLAELRDTLLPKLLSGEVRVDKTVWH